MQAAAQESPSKGECAMRDSVSRCASCTEGSADYLEGLDLGTLKKTPLGTLKGST